MSRANPYRTEGAYSGSESDFFGLGAPDQTSVMVTPSGQPTNQAEPWYQTLLKTAVPALTTVYAQNQMTKTNIARINAGQAPLTASEYAAVYQPPSAQVQVGPDASAKRMLLYGGLAVLAYVGLKAAKVI